MLQRLIYFVWFVMAAVFAAASVAMTWRLGLGVVKNPFGSYGLLAISGIVFLILPILLFAVLGKENDLAINKVNKLVLVVIAAVGAMVALSCLNIAFVKNGGGAVDVINGKWVLHDHSRIIAYLSDGQVIRHQLNELRIWSEIAALAGFVLAIEYYLRWRSNRKINAANVAATAAVSQLPVLPCSSIRGHQTRHQAE